MNETEYFIGAVYMMDIAAKYNRSDFIGFLSNSFLPEDFQQQDNKSIAIDKVGSKIKSAERLGFCESLDLSIYEFKHESLNDPRVTLSRESFKIIETNDTASNALAVFYSDAANWRLSLITSGYSLDKTNKQAKRDFSNPRRYSYLLGEGCKRHTPESMLFAKGRIITSPEKPLDDLVSRFAIEVVTKAFYDELFEWYQWALSGEAAAVYPNGSHEEHLIRLITRLMFVWFIKQKGLIPEAIFDCEELSRTLKDFDPLSKKSGGYYNAILQNLFFATLNRPVNERKFASGTGRTFQGKNQHYGIKTLYRDDAKETWFKKSDKEIIKLFKRVPFLNGGLFECLDKETDGKILYFDGFSRDGSKRFLKTCWEPTTLKLEKPPASSLVHFIRRGKLSNTWLILPLKNILRESWHQEGEVSPTLQPPLTRRLSLPPLLGAPPLKPRRLRNPRAWKKGLTHCLVIPKKGMIFPKTR